MVFFCSEKYFDVGYSLMMLSCCITESLLVCYTVRTNAIKISFWAMGKEVIFFNLRSLPMEFTARA